MSGKKKSKDNKTETEVSQEKILQHEIHDEMKDSYIDYAMSVIVGRALPDVRDGMKPVHRRILYGMSQLGITPDKPYKKSARIVGEVMGKYHPHGDSSIYDAMVRMAQDFSMRYPLVDGHGNFGSVDGDSAAAQRYTEARMSPFSMEMMRDINKDTVDFIPNFDGEEQEPVVLPSRYPNLLVNGSSGIAVGMATNIPPHNLKEVINGTVRIIDNPDISIKELMRTIKGPDFPTGAEILGKDGIREAYETGSGRIKVRSICSIEPGPRGKSSIIVTEIPYGVNKAKLIERIASLNKDGKVKGITDIRDESSREGMRIVIDLKKDTDAEITLNQLYKHSPLEETFGCSMLALVDREPRILNLKQILEEYLKFQKEVVTRRTRFDLDKALARAHILEGLLIALDNIDEVIRTIRNSTDDAKQRLMKKFGLTDVQAQAVLDMRLARLQKLERKKLQDEYKMLQENIQRYRLILSDERELMNVIRSELLEIRDRWGDSRRTRIVSDEPEITEEDLIHEEQVTVTITRQNYIKKLNSDFFDERRELPLEEKISLGREDDYIEYMIRTTTLDTLLIFSDRGRCFRLRVNDIPKMSRAAKGTPIRSILGIGIREKIVSVVSAGDFPKDRYLLFVTEHAMMKMTAISEYQSRRESIQAINLKDDDRVAAVLMTDGTGEYIMFSSGGRCISVDETDIKPMGRAAAGVRGMSLGKDDAIKTCIRREPGAEVITCLRDASMKRTRQADYKLQARGGKGVFSCDASQRKEIGFAGASVRESCVIADAEGHFAVVHRKDVPESTRAGVCAPLVGLAVFSAEYVADPEIWDTSELWKPGNKAPAGTDSTDPAAGEPLFAEKGNKPAETKKERGTQEQQEDNQENSQLSFHFN